jgi:hypothetical protein
VSDPDPGGKPVRKRPVRPDVDAVTEQRRTPVDHPPNAMPADTSVRPAVPFESSMAGPSVITPDWSSTTSVTVTSAAVGAKPAAKQQPHPVQVVTSRRGPRRARLVIKHVDPWTVMKVSFVVSVVMLAVCIVAVAIIYAVLGERGVWNQINTLVNEVSPTSTSKALRNPLSAGRVIGIAAAIGAINVILLTALSTLGAAIYNLISDLVGGVEVTLSDP